MKNGNLVTTIEIKDKQGRVVATKDVVTYAGLLNRAHQEGLKKVITRLVQAPSKDNEMTAISMAKVVTDKGVFIECGDASPGNVDTKIIPHIIRMSVTRAKARAMRDAVNIGALSLEEMAEEFGNGSGNGNGSGDGMPSHGSPQSEVKFMTPEQRKFLFKLLAEKGVAADDGHAWLCKAASVEDVKFITKKQASELIDHLRRETLIPKPQQTEEGKVS